MRVPPGIWSKLVTDTVHQLFGEHLPTLEQVVERMDGAELKTLWMGEWVKIMERSNPLLGKVKMYFVYFLFLENRLMFAYLFFMIHRYGGGWQLWKFDSMESGGENSSILETKIYQQILGNQKINTQTNNFQNFEDQDDRQKQIFEGCLYSYCTEQPF